MDDLDIALALLSLMDDDDDDDFSSWEEELKEEEEEENRQKQEAWDDDDFDADFDVDVDFDNDDDDDDEDGYDIRIINGRPKYIPLSRREKEQRKQNAEELIRKSMEADAKRLAVEMDRKEEAEWKKWYEGLDQK